jgi:hypothetical protein
MMPAGRFRFAGLAFVATLAAASQLGQLSQQSQGATPAQDGKVRVYVYRSPGITAKEFRPSVYVDEMDVARLQAGHNVILALSPGSHTFRSTDKKDQFVLEVKPGQRYYIRIEVSVAAVTGRGKLTVVLPEQGAPEYGQTKPADKSMLKDRMLVAPEFIGGK